MFKKINEHVKDTKVVAKDPTKPLITKFQCEILWLKKENKIDKQLL